jgi:predicted  nucleic acid-binding Zn-ribbon protein
LSRAEEITSEVRKLVLTCRSLEAQLQQSIPKKVHQEVVSKMQASMDLLSADLTRAKAELDKTTSIGERLESQVVSQNETISSQSKTIGDLSTRLAETSAIATQYSQAVSKVQELESKISSMVDSSQYASMQQKCSELEAQIASMVPRAQFTVLEVELANSVPMHKYEELQRALEQMVPQEYLRVAEARVSELENALAGSVPKSDFEELASKIAQITKEAVELASRATAAFPEATPTAETVEPYSEPQTPTQEEAPQAPTVPFVPSEVPIVEPVVVETNIVEAPQPIVQIQEAVMDQAPAQSSVSEPEAQVETPHVEAQAPTPVPDITEVQSQLSEIHSAMETGASTVSPTVVAAERGFRFSNSEFCARSGLEFLEDLEKVDVSVLAAHCQSGDFERWFKEVLADETTAQSFQKIRESNTSGEELRSMMIVAIAPRYRA